QALVAVQREPGAVPAPPRRSEAKTAAAAERLLLPHGVDLRAETTERVDERLLLATAASDDHPGHARVDESRNGELGERMTGDGNERLRQAERGLAEALRLPAREQQRLHQ